ncbi:MAG: type 2 lanthipeptide synthetase LanM [Gemmatimonadota bacterium]
MRSGIIREATTSEPVSLPFGAAYAPFIEDAERRLEAKAGPLASRLLARSAREDLVSVLEGWIAAVSGKVLAHEFALYRLDRRSSIEMLVAEQAGGSNRLYRGFIDHLLAGDWDAVDRAYPELKRLRNRVVATWIATTVELLERLDRDRDLLGHAFAGESPAERVTSVRPLSDDRHDGGRIVLRLTFDDGARIVYKPRTVGIEAWFGDFLSEVTSGTRFSDLRTPDLVDRGGYGWAEFIDSHACESEAAVSRFFERGGALLAVLHALGSVDCHLENIIASGEHPVLVDAETVIQAEPGPWLDEPGPNVPPDDFGVMQTGFLPNPVRTGAPDTSGLDGGRRSVAVEGVLVWKNVGSDRMALREGAIPSPTAANGVHLGHERIDPRDFVASITHGFEVMYRQLLERRASVLDSWLWASARERRVRFLARSTSTYWLLALSSLEPRFLADESRRREELERVYAPLSGCERPRRLRPLLEAEFEALDNLDVPAFSVAADATDLELPDCTVTNFFSESSLARAERRLRSLDEADCARQVAHIRMSLDRSEDVLSVSGGRVPASAQRS